MDSLTAFHIWLFLIIMKACFHSRFFSRDKNSRSCTACRKQNNLNVIILHFEFAHEAVVPTVYGVLLECSDW